MRKLNEIILHSSATPEGREHTAEEIKNWHVKGNGWSDIGYHFVIQIDGTIEKGRPIERMGAHVRGHNRNSIGVCYIGGCDQDMKPKDTITKEQQESFSSLVHALRMVFDKDLLIKGHNDYTNKKACPGFKVSEKFVHLL